MNAALKQKITQARSMPGQAHQAYQVAYANIRELIEQQAKRWAENPFLIHYAGPGNSRESISYGQFATTVKQIAAVLAQEYAMQRGDRIATLLVNHPDTVFIYFAAWYLGAVVVPINVEEAQARIDYIIENSGAKLCIKEKDNFVQTALHTKAAAENFPTVEANDDALIVYTSGTTGNPKGVVLSQYNLLADARAISDWHQIVAADRMMNVLPIHHVNGTVVTLMTPFYVGASVVVNRRFSASHFWQIASAEQIAIVSVVPTLLHFLYEKNEHLAQYNLNKFRHFICGAGPLTVELAKRFVERFGLRIIHGYGLSETTCYSCFLPVDLTTAAYHKWIEGFGYPSIGVPLPCNEMAIFDPASKSLGPQQRGEIMIRGHNVMKGYFANLEANEKAFAHAWFGSGDEGFFELDEQGRPCFFITGRIKELIARGGVKFAPLEIDEVLNAIPGVRHGVAVGFENDAYGEEVGAYVELEPGVTLREQEIIAACRKVLAFSKSPKVVRFGKDIPYTSTGKIQRIKLRPLFEEFRSQQFRE